MKFSAIFIFAAIAFLGECAKLPEASKNSDIKAVKNAAKVAYTVKKVNKENPTKTKQDAVKGTKHASSSAGKVVKDTVKAAKLSKSSSAETIQHSTTKPKSLLQNIRKQERFEAKDKKNAFWSPKSVIVPHRGAANRDSILNRHIASNPILDNLYQERYEALEKVSAINDKIKMLLNRKPTTNGASQSSFLSPGAFDAGSYRVQGGTMFLGPANAGDVAGLEYGRKRDESPAGTYDTNVPGPSFVNPVDSSQGADSNALADMPQPMYDQFVSPDSEPSQEDKSHNVTVPNDTDAMAAMDDQLVLGDPEIFDSVCSVLKLTFEHTQGAMVLDDSPQANNAELENGAFVSSERAKSGLSMNLGVDGYMDVPDNFNGKPTKAAAVSMWVKLKNIEGNNPLFQAYDNDTIHYELAVIDGKASWLHRDDHGKELFNVTSNEEAKITPGKWHHVVGAYGDKEKEATLWLDGKEVGSEKGVSGPLSQNWDKLSMFKGKTAGIADNVFMFRCSLDRTKVVALYVASASPKDEKRSGIPKVKTTH